MNRLFQFLLILAVAPFLTGFGDPAWFANKDGNDKYAEGKFSAAQQAYKQASEDDPESATINYNRANALSRLGNYQQAIGAYQLAETSDDPALRDKVDFNYGAALYNGAEQALQQGKQDDAAKMIEESVTRYKRLARFHPGDIDVTHNLELALDKQREIKQRKEEQEQKKEKKKEEQGEEDKDKEGDKSDDPGENSEQKKKGKDEKGSEPDKPKPNETGDDKSNSEDDGGQPQEPTEAMRQPGQMSKQEVEQIFNAVERDEQEMREKMKANVGQGVNKSGKDW